MIQKRKLNHHGNAVVRVTFILPATLQADKIFLVGDFNQWQTNTHPFGRDGMGNWVFVLDLEPGETCQFRYLSDGVHWMNDTDADGFVENEHGTSNFVVVAQVEEG